MPALSPSRGSPGVSRRDFLRIAGATGIVTAVESVFGPLPRAQAVPRVMEATKKVILLWLRGGASQLDTFDPAYDASEEIRGQFGSLPTRSDYRISDTLPLLASRSREFALMRNFDSGSNDHETAKGIILNPDGRNTLGRRLTSRDRTLLQHAIIATHDDFGVSEPFQPQVADMNVPARDWSDERSFYGAPDTIRPIPENRIPARRPLLEKVDNLRLPHALESVHGQTRTRAFDITSGDGRLWNIFNPSCEELHRAQQQFGPGQLGASLYLATKVSERDVQCVTVHHGGGGPGNPQLGSP